MIIGHQNILAFFDQAILSGSLAHTYCFSGLDQVGKRTVARFLAAKLLGVEIPRLGSHPDYYYIERLTDEKSGKLKKEISVVQARELRSKLQHRSWIGKHQVVIINEAELLNEESANALLKILEEPPAGSVFFILTEHGEKLLPTIRSRSQLFNFSLLRQEEIEAGLKALGYIEKVESAVRLCFGRPGKAITMLDEPEWYELYQIEIERFRSLINQPFYKKLKVIESVFGDKEDGERGREKIETVLDLWIGLLRENLLKQSCGRELVLPLIKEPLPWTAKQTTHLIDKLFYAKDLLRRNTHPRLLIEELVLHF